MSKRTLLVLRHAKSDYPNPPTTDHERPLNDRGRREAPVVAARLAERGFFPQTVLASDSTRTRQTWELMARYFPLARASFHRELYLASLGEVAALAELVPESTAALLVLGHNPGFEEMLRALTGTDIELKTAYCAVLCGEAPTFRELLRLHNLEVVDIITPRQPSIPG